MAHAGANGLAAANAEYRALFQEIFGEQIPGIASEIATMQSITGSSLTVTNSMSHPRMRQWLGDKVVKSLRSLTQDIPLVAWEATVGLKRVEVDYDKSGTVTSALSAFLNQQVSALDDLVIAKLLANPTGYDGVSLISNSHPYSNSTGDNLTTDALSFSSLEAMDTAMRSFQDEVGRPLHVTPNLLLVGESNRHTALQITGANRPIFFNASAAEATSSVIDSWMSENPFASHAVIVSQWITGTQWFLQDTTKPYARPIVVAEGRALEAVPHDEMNSEARFLRDEYLYSVEGDLGFGAGLWQVVGGKIAA